MVITAAPRMIPEVPKKVVDFSPLSAAPTAPVLIDATPSSTTVTEPDVAPAAATTPVLQAVTQPRPTIPSAQAEHPCPTCSRGLTYIPPYNPWYCYSCRAHAPKARSEVACPRCGG